MSKVNVNSSSPDDWLPSRPKRVVMLDDLHQELVGSDLPAVAIPAALAAVAAGGYYLYRKGQGDAAPARQMSYPVQQADDGGYQQSPAMPNPMASAPPDMGSYNGGGYGAPPPYIPPSADTTVPPPPAGTTGANSITQALNNLVNKPPPVVKGATVVRPVAPAPVASPIPKPASIASVVNQVAAKIAPTPQPQLMIPSITKLVTALNQPAPPPAPAPFVPKVPMAPISAPAPVKATAARAPIGMHGDVDEQVVFMSGTASGAVAKGIQYGLAPLAWAVKETGNVASFLGNALSSMARKL